MFKKFIFALSVLCVLLEVTFAGNDANSNAAEFREMCDFIKILRRKPEKPSLYLEGKPVKVREAALAAVDTIRILNASTTDEQTYRSLVSGEEFDKVKENPVIREIGPDKWGELLSLWKAEKDAASGKFPIRPEHPALTRVHEKIGAILVQARQAYGKINKSEEEIEENIRSARRDMLTAAFGETGMKKGQGTKTSEKEMSHEDLEQADAVPTSFDGSGSSGLYVKQCDGQNGGKVGENIAADMTCLCAAAASTSSNRDMCVGTLSKPTSTFDKNSDAVELWGELSKACLTAQQSDPQVTKTTATTLRAIVLRHRAMLGKGAHFTGSSSNQGNYGAKSGFILGRHGIDGTGGPKCPGTLVTTHQTGICVNYATALEGGKEIPWVKKLYQAAEKLEANERLATLQLSFLSQIEGLKNKAEIYYDTALTGQGAPGTIVLTTKNNDTNGKVPVAANERDVLNTGSVSNYETAFAASVVLILLSS